MSIAIVLAYAVCFVPKTLTGILIHYKNIGHHLIIFLGVYKTEVRAINPCICFIFSGNHRQRTSLAVFLLNSRLLMAHRRNVPFQYMQFFVLGN